MASQFPLQSTGSDGSGSITTGGTAQNLFSGYTPLHGFSIFNPDQVNSLWFSLSGTASPNASGSIQLFPNGYYETPAGVFPFHAISIIGAVTGQLFTATQW